MTHHFRMIKVNFFFFEWLKSICSVFERLMSIWYDYSRFLTDKNRYILYLSDQNHKLNAKKLRKEQQTVIAIVISKVILQCYLLKKPRHLMLPMQCLTNAFMSMSHFNVLFFVQNFILSWHNHQCNSASVRFVATKRFAIMLLVQNFIETTVS